eukprot:339168_1
MSSILFCFLLWLVLMELYAVIIWCILYLKQDRIHFIEIHDQYWCPRFIRNIIINSIANGWCFFNMSNIIGSPALTASNIIYNLFHKHIKQDNVCSRSDEFVLLDLCSGSGGPLPFITNQLNKINNVTVTSIVSDLYPHLRKWCLLSEKNTYVKYCTVPIDATKANTHKIMKNLNEKIDSIENRTFIRTMFASLHHFKHKTVISILADLMKSNSPIIIIELGYTQRESFLLFFVMPFSLLFAYPLIIISEIKYYFFEAQNLHLINKIMKIVLMIILTPFWFSSLINDAIISAARAYTESELLNLTKLAQVQANNCNHSSRNNIAVCEYEWLCWTQNSDMMLPLGILLPIKVLYGNLKVSKT